MILLTGLYISEKVQSNILNDCFFLQKYKWEATRSTNKQQSRDSCKLPWSFKVVQPSWSMCWSDFFLNFLSNAVSSTKKLYSIKVFYLISVMPKYWIWTIYDDILTLGGTLVLFDRLVSVTTFTFIRIHI